MFVVLSTRQPHPDKEHLVIDSMHRCGEESKRHKGLVSVHTLKDEATGQIFGIAIWDSQESYLAARPGLMKVTEKDDFDSWEKEPMRGHRLKSI